MEEIKIGNWYFRTGEKREVPKKVIQLLKESLKEWQETALPESGETWVAKNWGIPSCLVRIDMAPAKEEEREISKLFYEVEARPAGLGVYFSLAKQADFYPQASWKEIFKQFPLKIGFKICPSLIESSEDLRAFAEDLGFPFWGPDEIPPNEYLLFIRAKNNEPGVEVFENRAIAPLLKDGNKKYLLKQGLGKVFKDVSELPWNVGYAVKPLTGARLEGLEIFPPCHLKKAKGSSTKSRILKRLENARENSIDFVVQPFISPQREIIEGKEGWTIWRIFFGYKKEKDEWEFLGGWWNWRPNLRVHGASDAVFGLLF